MFLEQDYFDNLNGSGKVYIDELNPPPPLKHPNVEFVGIRIMSVDQKIKKNNIGVRAGGASPTVINEIKEDMMINGWRKDQPLISVAIDPDGNLIEIDGDHRGQSIHNIWDATTYPVAVYKLKDYSSEAIRDVRHAFNQTPPHNQWKIADGEMDLLDALNDGIITGKDKDQLEVNLRKFADNRSWAISRPSSVVGRITAKALRKFLAEHETIINEDRKYWENYFISFGHGIDKWSIEKEDNIPYGVKRQDLYHYTVCDHADQIYRPQQMWAGPITWAMNNNRVLKIILFSSGRMDTEQAESDFHFYAGTLRQLFDQTDRKTRPYELYVAPLYTKTHARQFENGEYIPYELL